MKNDIYLQLKDILVNYFELPEHQVTHEADLYEELDLDSIDTVDLMVQLREHTGLNFESEVFRNVRTVGDVIDELQQLMEA